MEQVLKWISIKDKLPLDNYESNVSDEYIYCCKYYVDNGGAEKRGSFAGIGECKLLGGETRASSFCDGFICAICNTENAT